MRGSNSHLEGHQGHQRDKRVLVIGSGLAGLTTAYLLRKEGIKVWLVEKSERIGFHSSSVEIPINDGDSYLFLDHDKVDDSISEGIGSEKKTRKEKTKKLTEECKWVVDVPMRSFQGGYYPLLISLYQHLQIPLIPTFYNYSFSRLIQKHSPAQTFQSQQQTYFIYSGASGLSIPALPSQVSTSFRTLINGVSDFLATLLCFIIWLIFAFLSWHDILPKPLNRQTPLSLFTNKTTKFFNHPISFIPISTGFGDTWQRFIDEIIIPVFSAVATMPSRDVLETPIGTLLDYAHSTVGTPHFTLGEGFSAENVAQRLVSCVVEQGKGHLRVGARIISLAVEDKEVINGKRSLKRGVLVGFEYGEDVWVDQVVIATQASAAVALLKEFRTSLKEERNIGVDSDVRYVNDMLAALEEVQYKESIVVTHTDSSILPSNSDKRDINLSSPSLPLPSSLNTTINTDDSIQCQCTEGNWYTMGTHVIISPPSLKSKGMNKTIYQTTNPICAIDKKSILAIAKLERALPVRDSSIFARLHPDVSTGSMQTAPLVLLAGSYAYPGIPLLEGCVGSAIKAVSTITGKQENHIGKVDWRKGDGSMIGRIWRYTRRKLE